MRKIIGLLIIGWGLVDLGFGWGETDLYEKIGLNIADRTGFLNIWLSKYSAWIAIITGGGIYALSAKVRQRFKELFVDG